MTPSSYDTIPDFGALYDAVPAYSERADVAFYRREAERAAGAVLEVGCGTGRILLPIARDGRAITGVDGSREMLARCEAKLAAEPADVRERVTLHHADVRELAIGGRFALVIAPFRILQHMVAIDDQLQFLDGVARHLAPGGRFVFDVFNPNFASLVGVDGTEREDTPEQPLPDGRTLRRTARVRRVRWVDQVNEIELAYHVGDPRRGTTARQVQAFDMRWYLRAELEHLLARAGLRIAEAWGDFDGSPLSDTSREIVIAAEHA